MDLSVIIPAYNEEENVAVLCKEIADALSTLRKNYEIVYIDDGSTDGTSAALAALAKADVRVRVIKFRKNFGQTAAIDAGFKHAKGKILVTMDADLQNDPADIAPLLRKLDEGLDVVSGWRKERKDSFSKRLISFGANVLRKALFHDHIHDSGCTLKAYRREAVEHLDLYGEMHRFIPALIGAQGFRVGETIVHHRPRRAGATKYRLSRVLKGFMDMLVVSFWMRYGTRPAHFFGGIGAVTGGVGFVIATVLSVEKFLYGVSLSNRPMLLLAALLILFGAQLIIFGFLADILTKLYYRDRARSYAIAQILN